MKSIVIMACILVLTLVPTLPEAWAQNGVSFLPVRVTNNLIDDTSPTIAVDNAGHAHVAYESGGDIYYTTNASGSWSATLISIPADDNYRPTILVDSSGAAHVAYLHVPDSSTPPLTMNIYYATNASGAWVGELAGNGYIPATWALHLSMALDGTGHAYIAYHTYHDTLDGGGDYDLQIRYQEGSLTQSISGGWVTLIVADDDATYDRYPSLQISKAGQIQVAFQRSNASTYVEDVWIALYSGGNWYFSQVAADMSASHEHPSLALDENGKAHIAMGITSMEGYRIGYATNASGAWAFTVVASDMINSNPSILVDRSGKAHIVYEYFDSKYYIYYANNLGGSWSQHMVASATNQEALLAWNDAAVALDGAGYVHVVYYDDDGTDMDICYAKSDQPVTGSPAYLRVWIPYVGRR